MNRILVTIFVASAVLFPGLVVGQSKVFPNKSVFVSADQLKANLSQPKVKIVDVRGALEYSQGHIPNAVNVPWHATQVPERDGLRSKWATDADLEKAFSSAGLTYDDEIVLYDATAVSGGKSYVIFTAAGFPNLHVLDGGIAAWKGELSKDVPAVKASSFKLTRKDTKFVVGRDYVASKIGNSQVQIVDGRSVQAYEDGHIPTASQLSPNDTIGADKKLKTIDEIKKLWASRGVTPDKEVVSYCGSGGAASQNFLILKSLGYDNVVLYDDSWDDWSRNTSNVQEIASANFTIPESVQSKASSSALKFWSETELKKALESKSVIVLDVRSTADYNAGRIPGSINSYWNDTLDAQRNLKPLDQIADSLAKKGVTPDKKIVIFTRGGVQLSHAFTVLKLLGYSDVGAFTGRWDGWHLPSWDSVKKS